MPTLDAALEARMAFREGIHGFRGELCTVDREQAERIAALRDRYQVIAGVCASQQDWFSSALLAARGFERASNHAAGALPADVRLEPGARSGLKEIISYLSAICCSICAGS